MLLDRALAEAGIDRRKVFVTNVVKHFKWTPKGKRRIHKKPAADEIAACRPWLQSELSLVRPKVLVALGATAAQALLGRTFLVSKQRGRFVESDLAPRVTATVHPSSILRAPDDQTRHAEMEAFVRDLATSSASPGSSRPWGSIGARPRRPGEARILRAMGLLARPEAGQEVGETHRRDAMYVGLGTVIGIALLILLLVWIF